MIRYIVEITEADTSWNLEDFLDGGGKVDVITSGFPAASAVRRQVVPLIFLAEPAFVCSGSISDNLFSKSLPVISD